MDQNFDQRQRVKSFFALHSQTKPSQAYLGIRVKSLVSSLKVAHFLDFSVKKGLTVWIQDWNGLNIEY